MILRIYSGADLFKKKGGRSDEVSGHIPYVDKSGTEGQW
jgi:hypothetical protein